MKRIVTILTVLTVLVICLCTRAKAQELQITKGNITTFLGEIKEATTKGIDLWNKDLYGAMIFINPQTRQIFANDIDTAGFLKPDENIYSGFLPENINFANTAIEWNGKRWTMIILPLPQNIHARINLLAHELFHAAQPALGFSNLRNSDNNHLDLKEGRIYLRLELKALEKAVVSQSEKESLQHLTNALTFRKYRNMLYPDSELSENMLELNEGLAEFTGLIISGREKEQSTEYFVNQINAFFNSPTFVRSFAYFTTPAYGYLLYSKNKKWNKDITETTNLTEYFTKAFNINIPNDLEKAVETISDSYNGKTIIKEETAREEKNRKLIAEYKQKFIESPHFEIQFEQMNVAFNPNNLMPLEDRGTVYPNVRVTDLWGILTVENGALMGTNWNKITVTNPVKIEDKKIIGDGWILELTENYTVEKEDNGNYRLTKK
jgi:hypothetical protein